MDTQFCKNRVCITKKKEGRSAINLTRGKFCQLRPWGRENFCPLQGSFGPFGPKVAKRARNEFLGPLGLRGPKSPKRIRKRVTVDYFSTILALFRLHFGLFGPPGTHFGLSLPLWARRAQMTPVAGPENPSPGVNLLCQASRRPPNLSC